MLDSKGLQCVNPPKNGLLLSKCRLLKIIFFSEKLDCSAYKFQGDVSPEVDLMRKSLHLWVLPCVAESAQTYRDDSLAP